MVSHVRSSTSQPVIALSVVSRGKMLAQTFGSPRRHDAHNLQAPRCQLTPTRCPIGETFYMVSHRRNPTDDFVAGHKGILREAETVIDQVQVTVAESAVGHHPLDIAAT